MRFPMKFGLVGLGAMGQLRARSVMTSPETELVAVADIDGAKAEQLARRCGARAWGDYHELLEREEIAAVIVSTPAHLHEEMALAALGAGKHVLCEKPLTNGLESARRVLRAAADADKKLAVGFNHRYYPAFRFLKSGVDDGWIGELDHLRVFGGHDGLSNFRAPWMYEGSLSGGGAMMDVGLHMTDLARYVLGEIREVYGVAGSNIWGVSGSEDRALAILKSDAGVPAIFEATWNEWKGYRTYLEAYGRQGMIRAAYAPMFNMVITQEKPGAPRRRRYKLYPEIALRERFRGWQSTTLLAFQEELDDFLRMIRGEEYRLADGWAGVRAIEIASALYESQTSGAPVRLSESSDAGSYP